MSQNTWIIQPDLQKKYKSGEGFLIKPGNYTISFSPPPSPNLSQIQDKNIIIKQKEMKIVFVNHQEKIIEVDITIYGNGSINPDHGTYNIKYDERIEFEVIPDENNRFKTIIGSCGGRYNSDTGIYRTNKLKYNCKIDIHFELIEYEVKIETTSNGLIQPDINIVTHGDNAEFLVEPDFGYIVDVDNIINSCDNGVYNQETQLYTINNITEDCVIKIPFILETSET